MEAVAGPFDCYATAARIGRDWSEAKRSGEIFADNALSQAMKILAACLPAVLQDLCPSCYHTMSSRLAGIASGLELAEIIGRKYARRGCAEKGEKEEDDDVEEEEEVGDGGDEDKGSEEECKEREEDGDGKEDCWDTRSQAESSASVPQVTGPTTLERERFRFTKVGRTKDFAFIEVIRGRRTNILQGLELHTNVFSAKEQSRLLDFVFELERQGRCNELRERTYSAPSKWMQGKGRVTLQFGCCYNYATDKYGNSPGIVQDEEVDPLPPLLKSTIRRLVRWQVMPPDCVPDSCIINIYEPGDCIPPHIDHHDFLRPFCTVSLLSECSILFGAKLPVAGPGQFEGSFSLPLPVGSVLVLSGNGADVAKHCIPAVPSKRVSLTFRKMNPGKRPYSFESDPSMQTIPVLR